MTEYGDCELLMNEGAPDSMTAVLDYLAPVVANNFRGEKDTITLNEIVHGVQKYENVILSDDYLITFLI